VGVTVTVPLIVGMVMSVWPLAVVVLVVVLEDVPVIEPDEVGMAGMHDGKLARSDVTQVTAQETGATFQLVRCRPHLR
jgi:hypothetical protein